MANSDGTNFELAMLDAYSALARVLDKSGAIRAQDLVDALGEAAKVRKQDGDTEASNGLARLNNKIIQELRVEHPPIRKAAG